MHFKILTCNCEKGYMPDLTGFLARTFAEKKYDFVLLQELRVRESPLFDPELKDILGDYSLLRTFNKQVGMWSEIGLAYRKSFTLEESKFFPFPPFKYFNHLLPEFGLLLGTFSTPEGRLRVGSLHMHPSLFAKTRGREVRCVKKELLILPDKLPIIFGGDFNSGLPWEKPRNRKILLPELVNITNDLGPTVDSHYVEPTTPLNALARAATKFFRFRLRMTVDHIYADRQTATSHTFTSRILPDRISDHSPLEVVLGPDQSASP